jgi:ectoine hydroxylase-related dioxygenase (phytanoyl-CoA dioxygenase family)
VPQLLLVALEDETTMDVWPGSHRLVRGSTDIQDPVSVVHVSLNKGDALLFRGDLVHAGSAYTKPNVRIHFYLDSPLVKRVANRTWIISKHAEPGLADMIREES